MYVTHTGILNYPLLPLAAHTAYLMPELQSQPLLSVGILCNAGCMVTFTAADVRVTLDNQHLFTDPHNVHTHLWFLAPAPLPCANNLTVSRVSPSNRIAFAHASLFLPVLTTLQQALDRH